MVNIFDEVINHLLVLVKCSPGGANVETFIDAENGVTILQALLVNLDDLIGHQTLPDDPPGDGPVEVRHQKLVRQRHKFDQGADVQMLEQVAVPASVEVVEESEDGRLRGQLDGDPCLVGFGKVAAEHGLEHATLFRQNASETKQKFQFNISLG